METEFFTDKSNLTREIINLKSLDEYNGFSHLSDNDIRILHARLSENDKVRNIFKLMKSFGIERAEEQIAQFIICNWSELDHVPDIDDNDDFNFEYVHCGLKPHGCPYNMMFCMRKTKFQ